MFERNYKICIALIDPSDGLSPVSRGVKPSTEKVRDDWDEDDEDEQEIAESANIEVKIGWPVSPRSTTNSKQALTRPSQSDIRTIQYSPYYQASNGSTLQ
jgi:hypothetical protein